MAHWMIPRDSSFHTREWMCNNANKWQNNNIRGWWMLHPLSTKCSTKSQHTVFICFWNLWQIDIVVRSPTQLLNFLSANFHGFRGLEFAQTDSHEGKLFNPQMVDCPGTLIQLVLLHIQNVGTDKSPTMRVSPFCGTWWAIVRIVTLFAEITRLKTRRHVRMRKDRRKKLRAVGSGKYFLGFFNYKRKDKKSNKI